MTPGGGRKPRLTHAECSSMLSLVQLPPPGTPIDEPPGELHGADPQGAVEWTLAALTAMARTQGIQVARSQVRRILRQERVRWRHTRLWASRKYPDFVPQGPASSAAPPTHHTEPPSSVSTNAAP
jgi:transposase